MPFRTLTLRGPKPPDRAYPLALRTLGDRVLKRRLDLGLLQRDVAALLAVSKDTVTRWEKHATSPEVRHLPKIIEFLGYDPVPPGETTGQRIKATRERLGALERAPSRNG